MWRVIDRRNPTIEWTTAKYHIGTVTCSKHGVRRSEMSLARSNVSWSLLLIGMKCGDGVLLGWREQCDDGILNDNDDAG